MKAFHSGREAKEFLISELVAEAQRENVPLSEVERKMLYFTESGWTLPDMMKVSEDFDRDYDQAEYERKIAKLATKADKAHSQGFPRGLRQMVVRNPFSATRRSLHFSNDPIGGSEASRRSIKALRGWTWNRNLHPHVDVLEYQVQHPHAFSGQPRSFRVGCPLLVIRCLHASPIHPREEQDR